MKIYATLVDAYNELRDWFINNAATLSAEDREVFNGILSLGVSPVDLIVNSAEVIYAKRATFDEAAKTIAAGLFRFAAMNGFHGLAIDQRGERAATVLEGGSDADAPAPVDRYVSASSAPPAPTGL